MDSPKSPPNVETHDVQPEEGGEQEEISHDRCNENKVYNFKTISECREKSVKSPKTFSWLVKVKLTVIKYTYYGIFCGRN